MIPSDLYQIAWKLQPSSAAGKVNVKHPTDNTLNLSVDPLGGMSWSHNDQNYEQFTRNGVALEIAPGSDGNANAPTFVLLPK